RWQLDLSALLASLQEEDGAATNKKTLADYARAFSREVEAAWKEFAEDDCCCIDVERKRTFTMMIREGVAMH
ncbi:hypothetical protein ACRWDQ_25845, partial [Escherichia coli]